jgi:hypothetical protein
MKFVSLEAAGRGARFIPKMIRNIIIIIIIIINGLTLRKERGMGVSENGAVSRARIWVEDGRSRSRMETITLGGASESALFTIRVKCV